MNGLQPFGKLFRLVLDETGIKASTVARELQRERSLMYKWLSGASTPPATYVPLLVEVVVKHTTQAKRLILERSLRDLVRGAELPAGLRTAILRSDSLPGLLAECLDLALSPALPAAPARARPWTESWWSVVAGALFAATVGGVLWNVLNRIMGWPYFMGSAGEPLQGARALAWGFVTLAPVALPLVLLGRRADRAERILPAALFTVVGAAAALAFYSTGIRAGIEALRLAYAVQEGLIVVIYGLLLSVPSCAAALAAMPRRPRAAWSAAGLLSPTAAALAAFLVTLVIDRPVAELLQLRGFIVAFCIRLALFVSLYAAFLPGAPPPPAPAAPAAPPPSARAGAPSLS